MKLSEYMEVLKSLTDDFLADGKVEENISDPVPSEVGAAREDYKWAVKALHATVKSNRKSLGIFPKDVDVESLKGKMKDKVEFAEISDAALRMHIVQIRHELGELIRMNDDISHGRKEILANLLSNLTKRVHISDLGVVFGEEEMVTPQSKKRRRKKKPTVKAKPSSTTDHDTRATTEDEYEALMEELRRNGHIL